ncbi:MAG: hypothetical protein PHP01_04290 [Phycisphaerae bacterium]|nr:hypothetical protein [Phycisphaerae bacterium]
MNRELYFIPVLQNALDAGEPKSALRQAFSKIGQLAMDDEYRQGLENFEIFVGEVCAHRLIIEKDTPEDFTGYSQDSSLSYELAILKDNRLTNKTCLDENGIQSIPGVMPGTYTIRLSTGRILWKETLSHQDLIAGEILGSQNIKVAADSGDFKAKPVRIVTLLNGRIVLKIFKGFESGVIQIELE